MAMSKSSGIYIVPVELGRGFSLKFTRDAYVFVVDTKGTVGRSEAEQMIGRSSRT